MVNLDASCLKLELTPEAAIGIVQKEVVRHGWKKYDLSDIVTVYVPFYVFSFDVIAEGGAPPGKAAMNANTGEMNEFVPVLLERPIQRQKKTPEGMEVEVEPTNVRESEVEKVAAVKLANMLGAKRENIVISAVSKIYVPFFRMWIDVAGDSFKIEVDGALGYASGSDAIPKREKTWEESTSDTIQKMQSPSGIAQLAGATGGEVAKSFGSSGQNKYIQWAIIAVVIIVIGYFVMQQFNAQVACVPDEEFLSTPQFFGLIGARKIVPQELDADSMYVAGKCTFSSRENDKFIVVQVLLKNSGVPISTTVVNVTLQSDVPATRSFQIDFPSSDVTGDYELAVERLVG
ncbi:MAG: hypothetical protein V1722_03770 [Candidatus Micrarchaeota archaeon]